MRKEAASMYRAITEVTSNWRISKADFADSDEKSFAKLWQESSLSGNKGREACGRFDRISTGER